MGRVQESTHTKANVATPPHNSRLRVRRRAIGFLSHLQCHAPNSRCRVKSEMQGSGRCTHGRECRGVEVGWNDRGCVLCFVALRNDLHLNRVRRRAIGFLSHLQCHAPNSRCRVKSEMQGSGRCTHGRECRGVEVGWNDRGCVLCFVALRNDLHLKYLQ